ncbi:hypothetical protein DM02DRAFT_609613 [Periconia macrospinosa]|uniref:Uncharacterized protein n=1 Tax=Periconia macrospinosa TaxID=97972 RepID=A0A2V1EAY4_9PLEO|nr:hypothetical protein DM02DRAFT_609613 [Periconia macrospinosa]
MGSEKEARTAHDNLEWFETHFQDGRLQREQWYPAKVDYTDELRITDETRVALRPKVWSMIEEKEVTMTKMYWLGKQSLDKPHDSYSSTWPRKKTPISCSAVGCRGRRRGGLSPAIRTASASNALLQVLRI